MSIHSLHIKDWPEASGIIQTRSELTGLEVFDSLALALRHANKDKTVWKISYTDSSDNHHRYTRVQNTNLWNDVPLIPAEPVRIGNGS